MDEDEIYRQLEALKDRQDAKLPGIGAESDPLYHELDFRVQYELAIRSTRGPHVKDVHEHVRAPELVRALRRAVDEEAALVHGEQAPVLHRAALPRDGHEIHLGQSERHTGEGLHEGDRWSRDGDGVLQQLCMLRHRPHHHLLSITIKVRDHSMN